MRIVIEDATPEVLAALLTTLGTVRIDVHANGSAAPRTPKAEKPRRTASARPSKPKAPKPAKPKKAAYVCRCGAEYSYRKSFDNHLLVNEGDGDHGEGDA